uniref:OTU domain-containing protein n=1 Tax=Panagrolaimus davidi TaxID=227884 RepID=A0A914QC94_9BILA
MPPPNDTNQNDLFLPPDLQQLQHYLILLDLPPELAYNSPLLTSLAIEPQGRSPVTIDTRGDGNCGHRSFSKLLTGVEDYHWHIRLKIYEYIAANARRIFGIKSANLGEQACSRLVQLNQIAPQPVGQNLYAGNDDLWALAEMLECNIYTYVPEAHPAYPALNPYFKNNKKIKGAPTLFLLYINSNHFEPIVQFM